MQRIRESFLDAVLDAPLDDWMKRVRGILDTYENVGYTKAEAGENNLTGAILKTEEVKALLADLEAFSAQYKSVAERLGLSKTDSLENAKTANAVLSRLARRPEFHERVWYSNQNNGTALELVGIAEGHASSLKKLSSELYCAWTDTVRDFDLAAIHSRLFEEYPWMYNELAEGDIARVALAAHTSKAKELLQKITTLVEAHTKALGALGVTSEDSLDGLLSIRSFRKPPVRQ